jgi:nicotinamidase-related amidase
LCIWPPHCKIGTWGHGIVRQVAEALDAWEIQAVNRVNFVTKGSNYMTEHYSGVMADVPDPKDITTKLNTDLIDTLTKADEILITGEALSHCVANTITDIADNFGDDNIKKFVLLEDTSSSVPGFEQLGTDFVKNMVARGMRLSKTTEW